MQLAVRLQFVLCWVHVLSAPVPPQRAGSNCIMPLCELTCCSRLAEAVRWNQGFRARAEGQHNPRRLESVRSIRNLCL